MQEGANDDVPAPPGARPVPPAAPPAAVPGKHWRSEDLLGTVPEDYIAHGVQSHRPRRTSAGKTIITK